MSKLTLFAVVVLLCFGAYTAYVVVEFGYLAIFWAGLDNHGARQILLDLVIACALAIIWMFADAKRNGLMAWPFALLTLGAGSLGPLAYLVYRGFRLDRHARSATLSSPIQGT
ncbi:MAG: DUF2834 domain-containing protein [Pseudomonadota bacterium]